MRLSCRPLCVALLLSAVLGACYSGSLPQKRGSRPLTMPRGEHELVFGPSIQSTTPGDDPVLLGYRVGLTDRLELTNLTSLAYRFPIADRSELRLDAGAIGYFSRSFLVEYSGDPREPSRRIESAGFYATAITAKVDLGNEVHAIYSLRVTGSDSSLYGKRIDTGSFGAVAIYDGFGRLSIALPIATSYGLNRDRRSEIVGGVTIGGFGPSVPVIPVFSYVTTKQLDVFLSPAIRLSANLNLTLSASIGINWHWD